MYVGDLTLISRGSFWIISSRVRHMHTRQFPRDGISTNPQLKLSLGPPDLLLLGVTFIARSKYLRADSIWLASDCLRIK